MFVRNLSTPKLISRIAAISGALLLFLFSQTILIALLTQHLLADGTHLDPSMTGVNVSEQTANCDTSSYQVQPGDTIGNVAGRAGTTSQRVRECNDLSSDVVYAGQVLSLPSEVNNNQDELPQVRVTRSYRATPHRNNRYQAPNNSHSAHNRWDAAARN